MDMRACLLEKGEQGVVDLSFAARTSMLTYSLTDTIDLKSFLRMMYAEHQLTDAEIGQIGRDTHSPAGTQSETPRGDA
jgi:hypothetical protein